MNDRAYAGVAKKLDMLAHCPHEFELDRRVREIVTLLGGENYVFLLYQPGQEGMIKARYRYLIGCDPRWSQHYLARKWYMIDADLEYAKTHSAAAVASQIPLRTEGQRTIRAHGESHGFRSKFILPAHSPQAHRVGALFVGTTQAAPEGERDLLRARILYRTLANEILDWYGQALREDAVRFLHLAAKETRVLELLHHGYSAADIASELELALPTIYSYFNRLNKKFKVRHISVAVRLALFLGVLG